MSSQTISVNCPRPTAEQRRVLDSPAKRIVLRTGRRGGKTTGAAIFSVRRFLEGHHVLYATPTADQLQSWWYEIKSAFGAAYDQGVLDKNESTHSISAPGSRIRVRGKTAWNADSLRGDYADDLILDESQLIDPGAWEEVGAPMLLDNDGDAMFIYTPPNPREKALGYRMCQKLYDRGESDEWPLWASFHWTSKDNPHVSADAIERLARDMRADSYQREIMAEDTDEVPEALWTRELIRRTRVDAMPKNIDRIAVGVDPPGGATECGIAGVARADGELYIFADSSLQASPDRWSSEVVKLAEVSGADIITAEKNFGGDMVEHVIKPKIADRAVRYKAVSASRGKSIRAEPVVARFERGEAHIVGNLPDLEDELCTWVPGSKMDSPNRLDAMVWACTELHTTPSSLEVW